MPFRITTKNVFQFTWRRRTVDSAKEKLKGKLLKNIEHDLFTRGQMEYTWTRTDDSTEGKWKIMFFSFDYVIKEMEEEARVALGYRLVRLLRFFPGAPNEDIVQNHLT